MTRINLVPPEELMDQHLLAEWREMKMVPASLKRSLRTRSISDILKGIPPAFTLGRGHVTFFYDKMRYLRIRYRLLVKELLEREFDLEYSGSFYKFIEDIPGEFLRRSWTPAENEVTISRNRIAEKIAMKPEWYRYYGKSAVIALGVENVQ